MDLELIIGLISLVLSLLSILVAYILYRKSIKGKDLRFAIESIHLVQNNDEINNDIKILYKDQLIKHLTVSRIAIWNAGKESIRRNDLPPNNSFINIVPTEGNEILKAQFHKRLNISNNFKFRKNENNVELDFDFIDFKDGCSINIYHTGKSSWALNLDGFIIGSGKIKQAVHIPFPKRRKAFIYSAIFIILTCLPTFLLLGSEKSKTLISIFVIIGFLLYAILPMFISFKYMISHKVSLDLEVRDDDEILISPYFPPRNIIRKKDPEAEPYNQKIF